MRVLFLIPHPIEAASGRYRVFQYLPWLRQQGIQCEVRPFMTPMFYRMLYRPGRLPQKVGLSAVALVKRLADVVRSAQADAVVVHREALPLGTALLERVIARVCPAFVFDFDDAIYLNHTSQSNGWARLLKSGKKTQTIIALSSQVVVGNQGLEAYAMRYNPRVTVIPTSVDTASYHPRSENVRCNQLVIGWIGSHTTANYLRGIEPALAAITQRYPHVRIRVVGGGSAGLRLPGVESVGWTLDRELNELHQFDIGIMPMPDDEWARGKCGFKALLYMSVGIPVVASPVGVNRAIIREGVNGFLVADAPAWIARLSSLIEDAPLRVRLGQGGRAIVEAEYSLAVHAPRFHDVLRQAGGMVR